MRRLAALIAALTAAPLLAIAPVPQLSPAVAAAGGLPPGFEESVAFSGLDLPTAVRFAPDGRVFVAEKSGLLKTFDSLWDTTPAVFADLRTTVHDHWDRGLLGMALDPDFVDSPWVYVAYTFDAPIGGQAPLWGSPGAAFDPCPSPPGATLDGCVVSGRVSRLAASGATAGPEQVLVEDWCQQYPSHSLGGLAFGPDGALFIGAGDGASFTFADHGQGGGSAGSPTPVNPCGDPAGEGGAMRSQDLRSSGDPLGYDGSILRVDRATGAAFPGNPLAGTGTRSARMVAHGLRNPFRFTVRPGTGELWIADVGWTAFEEIDRLADPAGGPVEDFGWPCSEGAGRHPSYDALDLPLCEAAYGSATVRRPYFQYAHAADALADGGCGQRSSSLAGIAFYTGTRYPARFRDALFFADYSRRCIYAMPAGNDGLPDPQAVMTFHSAAAAPVELQVGPEGDLFYVDILGGTIRRIRYVGGWRTLSDIDPWSATNGFGPYERDRSNGGAAAGDGRALQLAGVRYARGLGVHALSRLVYGVSGCDRFRALVGVDDEVGTRGSVIVAVHGDGALLYRSPRLTGASATRSVDVDLRGVRQLRLSVGDGGDGINADHADWARARIRCAARVITPLFGDPVQLGAGDRPHSVVAADVDRDGTPDLVTANAGSDTAGVYLGNGNGTFRRATTWATGDKPKNVVAADLDGDGALDLVSANQDASTASVLLGNGDGTFGTKSDHATCHRAHEVAVGDIDRDGDRDLAVACWGGRVTSVLLGHGDGTFTPRADLPTGGAPHSVIVRDLDGDRRPDLAVADHGSDDVRVLLGRGDGTFRTLAAIPVGSGPHSIRASDLDEDGRLDLVTANDGSDDVSVLLGRGDGTFRAARSFPAGKVPKSVAIADLDRDGHLDVVVSNVGVNGDAVTVRPGGNRVTVLLGDGTGNLATAAPYVVGRAPFSVTIADLDGDGWRDVAAAAWDDDLVAVLRNAKGPGPSGVAPVALIGTPAAGTVWSVGQTIDFSGSASDEEDGALPASSLTWQLVLHHCPSACHSHVVESFAGASGSFVAPDHDHPSHLELRLTARDSSGRTDVRSLPLHPRTAEITFASEPPGVAITVGSEASVAPFTMTAIVGSRLTIGAASPQTLDGEDHVFASWSDGGERTHAITVPAGGTSRSVTFTPVEGP